MAVLADRCINPNCRELIRYEEGTQEIRCPWCDHAFLTREFEGEQKKIVEALMAGKQARDALAMERREKEALQALLNKSQQAWIDYADVQKHVREQLRKIEKNTVDIKGDTEELLAGQKEIVETIQTAMAEKHQKSEVLLKNARVMLSCAAFDEAKKLFDDVLKQDPENTEAYLGRLLVDMEVRHPDDLVHCNSDFSDNANYRLALEYGTPELKEGLKKLCASAANWRMIRNTLEQIVHPTVPTSEKEKHAESVAPAWKTWEKMYDFDERYAGMALIMNNNRYGLVNQDMQVVTTCKWDDISYFYDGLAVVRRNGREGAINIRGELVIPCEWERLWGFSDGMAIVRKPGEDKVGYIDKTGRLVIGCKWDDATDFQNGTANVKTMKKSIFGSREVEYIIDKLGNILREL